MSYGSIKIMVILRAINIFRNFKTCVRHFSFTAEPIAYLINCGVSKHVIDDNAFLANLKIDSLHSKMELLRQMRPRHIDDFVPLMKIEEETLREVAWKAIGEYDAIPEQHRIYYISRELQIAPVTVSKFCSRHETIFFAEFAGIAEKLKILLDYNVDSVQILQSLYVLDSSKNILFSRLDELSRRSHCYRPYYITLTDDEFRKVIDAQVEKTKEIPVESTHRLRNRNLQKSVIVTEINELLSCDDETSTHIYYNSIDNMEQLSPAKRIYRLLADNGVGAQCVQSNSVILTLPYDQVNHNLELIKGMRPHSIDDFLPLIAIETRSLQAFALEVNKRDIDLHPVYLFSRRLNIAPAIVSKHFANDSKLFFKQNFDGMVKKLDVLIAYNVDPMSILRSSDTFRLSAAEIETRLEQFKADGIDNVSSWMIAKKSKSKKSVAKKVEEKTVLGGCDDTVDYLATRLNWDAAARSRALKQYPSLVKCSVIKVKNHVDYLLNETHFTINDITSNVRVFRNNLDELKQRMDEMAAIGLVPSKLYAVFLDRQRYLDMVKKFCERKNCSVAFEAFKSIEKRVKNVKDD